MAARNKPQQLVSAAELGGAGTSAHPGVLAEISHAALPAASGGLIHDDGAAAEAIVAFLREKRLADMKSLGLLRTPRRCAHEGPRSGCSPVRRRPRRRRGGDRRSRRSPRSPPRRRAVRSRRRLPRRRPPPGRAAPPATRPARARPALVAREGYDTMLFAQSVLASDLAAALAARLDAGLNLGPIAELELRRQRPRRQASRALRLVMMVDGRLGALRSGSRSFAAACSSRSSARGRGGGAEGRGRDRRARSLRAARLLEPLRPSRREDRRSRTPR